MGKLRLGEVQGLAIGDTACERLTWDWNTGCLTPKSELLALGYVN